MSAADLRDTGNGEKLRGRHSPGEIIGGSETEGKRWNVLI